MDSRVAEVPAHRDPHKDPSDFVALNKSLRCCYICRLIKSQIQFEESGCDNCSIVKAGSDAVDYTTPNFSGMISVLDPTTSWATKWLHLGKYVPGCYALVVNDDPPEEIASELDSLGIRISHGQK